MIRKEIKSFLFLSFCLFIAQAYGGAYSNLNVGGERVGMLAYVAKAEDLTAIYHNPAGLTQLEGTVFHGSFNVGYVTMQVKRRYWDGSPSPVPGKEERLSEAVKPKIAGGLLPMAAVGTDFGLERWRFAIAMYWPNLAGAVFNERTPINDLAIRGFSATMFIVPTVAYKVNDFLSFGAGLSYIYTFLQSEKMYKFGAQDLKLKLDAYGQDIGYNLGVMINSGNGLRLGLSFYGRNNIDLTGKGSLGDWDLEGDSVYIFPRTLRAGINFQLTQKLQLGFDYTWWDYSVWQEMKLNLKIKLDPEHTLQRTEIRHMHFKDSYNYALGAEYKYSDKVHFLGGVMTDITPIPDTTFSLDAATGTYVAIGLGVKYIPSDKNNWTFSYEHQWQEQRNIRNSITNPPTNVLVQKAAFDTLVVEFNHWF